jgi:hypothetical protein
MARWCGVVCYCLSFMKEKERGRIERMAALGEEES